MRTTITVEGLPALRQTLDAQRFRQALRAAAEDALAPVVELASAAAPVRTGYLARTITVEVRDKGQDFEVVLGSKAFYGHMIERGFHVGSRFVPGRPFAEPAYLVNEQAVVDALEANLAQVLGWAA